MVPVKQLTLKQVQYLRTMPYGTKVTASTAEVLEMHEQLQTLFEGIVRLDFAERIALRNKQYEIPKEIV